MKKILFFCLPGIGDALMTTPTIKLLKDKFKNSEIDIACMFDGVKYVFKNNPNISNIYRLSLYKENKLIGLKQILDLRRKHYDITILSIPAYRREYHLLQWLTAGKKRIAHKFCQGYWSECNFLNTNLVIFNEDEHNVINNLRLLTALDIAWEKSIKKDEIKYDFTVDEQDKIFGFKHIKNLRWYSEDVVGIHPGSTASPAALLRRWPLNRYSKVARYLIRNKKKKVIIFVGPDEKDLGKQLYDLINDKTNCVLIDNLKFNQAIGILNHVKLLICNDNGFGHLANALGIKMITLWASTNEKWSLPYNKKLVILIRPERFEPWYRYDLKRSIPEGAKSGMENITINTVIKAINHIL